MFYDTFGDRTSVTNASKLVALTPTLYTGNKKNRLIKEIILFFRINDIINLKYEVALMCFLNLYRFDLQPFSS